MSDELPLFADEPGRQLDSLANEISGTVYGSVVQARDVGSLHIHGSPTQLPVPRQLPPAPAQFVNREDEVSSVDGLVARRRDGGTTPVVVVTGGRGVGKTATGRYWAHRNGDQFADGHLYADFGPLRSRGGVAVSDVLGAFLRSFGMTDDVIPVTLAERSALFRSSTAGKCVLVLLDDVEHAAEVQPLVPNTSESVVLVTSKSPLEELLYDGAGLLRLRPLDQKSALALLAAIAGEARVAAEPEAVASVIEICDGLPVALRICAARLARRPEGSIAAIVDELSDESSRLRQLAIGPEQSLQVVFDEAYRALAETERVLYRRIGLHPGLVVGTAAAAAAIAAPVNEASVLLEALVAAHLLEEEDDRFRFHDLLRVHARTAAERDDEEGERLEAIRRLVDFYLAAARRMDHAVIPDRLRLTGSPPPGQPGDPAPRSPAEALAWFEEERPNLVAALRLAFDLGWNERAWQFGEALFLAYHNHKHYEEAREVYALAAAGAERARHRDAEARMRSQLARALIDIGDYDEAARELAASRRLMEGSANAALAASIIEWTGVLHVARGDYRRGVAAFRESRERFAAIPYRRGVALQEYHLGRALHLAGDNAAAVEALGRARDLVDHEHDQLTLARVLLRLGQARRALGASDAAKETLLEAVALMERNDAPFYEATAREELALIEEGRGDVAVAVQHLARALAIYEGLQSPRAALVAARLQGLAV